MEEESRVGDAPEMAEGTNTGGASTGQSYGVVLDPADGLSADQKLNFKYTDMSRAPEHHVTVAYQFAMGMQIWDITGSTGYTPAYIEKILSHPPVIAAVVHVKETLNKRVLKSLNTWTQLLDSAIGVLESSLKSENERVALTAAVEYLDRHPSGMFIKRKLADGSGGSTVMDNNAIDELKRHALKLKGEEDDRATKRISGPTTGTGNADAHSRGAASSEAGAIRSAAGNAEERDRPIEGSELQGTGNGVAATDRDAAPGLPGADRSLGGALPDNGAGQDSGAGVGDAASPEFDWSDWDSGPETREAEQDLEAFDPI
ncbi:hypothetical protein LCGC14_0890350 [marine sediment metagenome]|uniref:Uncharacterized protein n=1 Tax=marine sediment metagenome TaxID=412755 RepID=A0A0F9NZH4_9ZZZZ